MARIRSVKPDLPDDVDLSHVSFAAAWMFVLLISQADDEGLQAGNTRQLLGSLYPHREEVTGEHVETWLAELVAIGSVALRETEDGSRVVQLVNWHKHQYITKKTPSRLLPRLLNPSEPSPESLRKDSGNVQEEEKKGSAPEVEVGSGSGSRKVEVEGAPPPPPTAKRDATAWERVIGLTTAEVVPDMAHRAALHGTLAAFASRNPTRANSLAAELQAIEQGMHGPIATWAQIAQALHEMAVAGAEMRAVQIRAFVRRVLEGAPPARAVTGGAIRVGAQLLTPSAIWELCVRGGLTTRGQSREAIEERVSRLHEAGEVEDASAFTALVMHVQPWAVNEIGFARDRDLRLAEKLATWRPSGRDAVTGAAR